MNISIPQSAQNLPVDRIESPYRINIEENRSTLKGRKSISLQNLFLEIY
jgi:hypothetical protein